ncbi:MAG TPA: agmatine deiminase family protein [Candidatus Hydrogenedentes bacterium]|nr:agmatine deiminase family protein [Candidatus Hydrogenedentota bacterium]
MTPVHRFPAEWEPHRATHLAFPSNCADWPGKFAPAQWAFVEMVRHLAEGETIRLAVTTEKRQQQATRMLQDAHVPMDAIEFHLCPLDRGWMRDISPFFVFDAQNDRKAVLFRFNGWAKYDNYHLDAQWGQEISSALCLKSLKAVHKKRHIVLEGGAVDTNGRGDLLTTGECLLDPTTQTRNPGFTQEDYENAFSRYLGIQNTIWLGSGIIGDDTHGHVDDICRFVNPTTVVLCEEKDSRSPNHAVLEENRERLENIRLASGKKLETVRLPMPAPLYFQSLPLPASYANFYIANGRVIVPTFNDVNDRKALGILADLFPDRKIIGIHAVDLVWGFGTLHCLSHEEPAE